MKREREGEENGEGLPAQALNQLVGRVEGNRRGLLPRLIVL